MRTLRIQHLDAILMGPDRSILGVVFLHGYGRSWDEKKFLRLGKELDKKGVTSLAISFSGWGQSGGEPGKVTLGQLLNDVVLARRFLSERCGCDEVSVFAHSLGASIVAAGIHISRFSRIALLAPALAQSKLQRYWAAGTPDFEDVEGAEVSFQKKLKHRSPLQNELSQHDYSCCLRERFGSVLHVHGLSDQTVPIDTVRLPLPEDRRLFLKGGGHDLETEEELNTWVPVVASFLVGEASGTVVGETNSIRLAQTGQGGPGGYQLRTSRFGCYARP